jgi:hypothetical protein
MVSLVCGGGEERREEMWRAWGSYSQGIISPVV